MLLKKKIKKKFKNLNFLNYKFFKKFLDLEGRINFKLKYKNKLNLWVKNRIKKNIKILRFLSLLPYTYEHIMKSNKKKIRLLLN